MKKQNKKSAKLLAYSVQGDECGTIVFANSGIEARRIGANMLNLEFDEVESCRRAQFADIYAAFGTVPPLVLIEQGWWWSCTGCGDGVRGIEVEREPGDKSEPTFKVPADAIILETEVWCSLKCKAREESKRATENVLKNTITEIVQKNWPEAGSIVVHLSTNPPQAHFMFPGGTNPAVWAYGAESVRVTAIDVAFWNAYVDTIEKPKP